jgi:hypothetical protein
MSSRRNDALNTSRKHREVMGDLENTLKNKKKMNNLKMTEETLPAFKEGDDIEAYLSKLGEKSRRRARHPLQKFTPAGVKDYNAYKGGKKRKSRKTKKSKKSRKSRKSRK